MATNFPSSLDNSTSLPYPSATNDTNSPSLSSGQSNQNDAVIATETKLGTGSVNQTAAANTVLLGTGSGASEWGAITTSYLSSTTGSGAVVLTTSPTIATATLTSPTISSPTISGTLGNISTGTITASGLITGNAGLTISSGSITLPSNSILSGLLGLSSSYTGGVTSYTNSGSAGGTGYYINLGGLKICWGTSSVLNLISGSNGTAVINFPTSFFSTIQSCVITPTGGGVTSNINFAIVGDTGPSTSSVTIYFFNTQGSSVTASCIASWMVMGT